MRDFVWFLLMCVAAGQQVALAGSCLFSSYPPPPTISEAMSSADAVVLGEWVSAEKRPWNGDGIYPPRNPPGQTSFKVVEIFKDSQKILKKNSEIVVEHYHAGKPGDLALVIAAKGPKLEWDEVITVTEKSLHYIRTVPKQNVPWTKRLEFYLEYLESPDEVVANDAYREFEKVPFEEIKKISEKLPREKLRQWIGSKKISVLRLGLYGEMLGLCGNEQDVLFMEDLIKQPVKPNDFRLGMDGIMGGYLLLTGEEGLKLLEETKLKPGVKTPFSETYCAMVAVRFAWDYGDIKRDRLKQSMRLLLDRPEVADLAIWHLTRWKDWDIQDKVLELYGRGEFDQPATKRAIVNYLLACSKDTAENADGNPTQEHARLAKIHLGTLREKDPDIVKQAERYFEAFR